MTRLNAVRARSHRLEKDGLGHFDQSSALFMHLLCPLGRGCADRLYLSTEVVDHVKKI